MESISTAGLNKLENNLREVLEKAPEQRAELHARVGVAIKQRLDSSISGSINDQSGHVRKWQIVAVGSHGGYAAVRPVGSKEGGSTGRDSQGAITNYLTGGHAVRKPSGKGKDYRSRANIPRVPGGEFYRDTAARTEQIATKEIKIWADEVATQIAEGL